MTTRISIQMERAVCSTIIPMNKASEAIFHAMNIPISSNTCAASTFLTRMSNDSHSTTIAGMNSHKFSCISDKNGTSWVNVGMKDKLNM